MDSQSINNDAEMACAKNITSIVAHLLREEEQLEFFGLVKEQIHAAFVTRDFLLERQRKRLNPLTLPKP